MPILTLSFSYDLNVSVQGSSATGQGGDILYYINPVNNQGGTNHPNSGGTNTKPKAFGEVISVNHVNRTVTYDDTGYPPIPGGLNNSHYIFFSKDRRANTSGIIGYYAETEYRNYTKLQAEIFATAVDYVESSK